MKRILALATLFTWSVIQAQGFDPKSIKTGLKPDSPALASSLKEANPNRARHRDLSSKVDLSEYMPPVGNQGPQGSCVAWSTAYATKSYQEYLERKGKVSSWKLSTDDKAPNYNAIFSPAFIYNQINGGRDDGSSISDAMSLVVDKGVPIWNAMPYNSKDFKSQPSSNALKIASQYKAKEFMRVRYNEPDEIKAQLSKGRPVVVGILIYENFYNLKGKEVYNKAGGAPLGGHAITIVGYNDSDKTFKFINSWSEQWGDKGYGYIDYKWFSRVCQAAYVMIDEIDPNITTDSTTEKNPETTAQNDKPGQEDEPQDLAPPEEIQASNGIYSKKIVLTWSKVTGAVGYEIYRQGAGDSKYSKIGLSQSTTFEDSGVNNEISYNYKIATVGEYKISEPSDGYAVGFAKDVKSEIPPKIVGLVATSGKYYDRIALEWEPLEDVTGYQVFKWNSSTKSYKSVGKTEKPYFEDTTARKNGGSETYTVAGLNKNVTGLISDAAIGKTSVVTKPAPPEQLEASRGLYKDKVVLKWKKVAGAAQYVVYRYTKGKNKWERLNGVASEIFEDTNASNAKSYYSVAAINKEGMWSNFSSYALGFIDPKSKRAGLRLEPPKDLKANLDKKAKTVKLTWKGVDKSNEYSIWQKKQGESNWSPFKTLTGKETTYSFPIPGDNTLFLYAVTSKPELGEESERSNLASVVFSPPKPHAKKRAFGGDSKLEKFKGTWTAMQWDGKSQVKNVVIEIEPIDDNTGYNIKVDNKKTFTGKYVQDSPILDIDGKLKVKLSSNEDSLTVEMKDKSIVNEKGELSFLKE